MKTRQVLIGALLLATAACGGDTPAEAPAASTPAGPNIQTREVTYTQNGTTLSGLLVWDANITERRPGVLVVHEWWGVDDHQRNQARRLAEAGYVAFALDMYGDGKHAMTPEEASKLAAEASADQDVMRRRFEAAREMLASDERVDPERIAAIGYCFGGMVVLQMARAGMDLDAVVSFHGLLETQTPAQQGQVRSRVLVLTGEADNFVPPQQVENFRKEMDAAGVNYRVVSYPNAKHAFTNPNAADHNMPDLAYDAAADQQSWQEMLTLFEEIF